MISESAIAALVALLRRFFGGVMDDMRHRHELAEDQIGWLRLTVERAREIVTYYRAAELLDVPGGTRRASFDSAVREIARQSGIELTTRQMEAIRGVTVALAETLEDSARSG